MSTGTFNNPLFKKIERKPKPVAKPKVRIPDMKSKPMNANPKCSSSVDNPCI